MGVAQAYNIIFKSIELTWDHFVEVLYALAKENARAEDRLLVTGHRQVNDDANSPRNGPNSFSNVQYQPSLDIDANCVGFKNIKDPVGCVLQIVNAAADAGSRVGIMRDSSRRHFSKRASTCREINREKSRLAAIKLESELSTLLESNPNATEATKIAAKLQKERSAAERKLPISFHDNVMSSVEALNSNRISAKVATYQADPLIAKRSMNNLSDIIWSSDSDFIAHDPACVIVNNYYLPKSGQPPSKIMLATGMKNVATLISNALLKHAELRSKDIFNTPKHPICDLGLNAQSRALLACAIGNDYWVKGQPHFGTSAACKVATNVPAGGSSAEEEFVLDQIAKHGAGKSKGQANVVTCAATILAFAMAFIYEPANEEGHPLCYIHNEPVVLPMCLQDFAHNSCNVESQDVSPKLMECVYLGYDGETHKFLEKEGAETCSVCRSIVCTHCNITENTAVCFGCFRGSFGEDMSSPVDLDAMKRALKNACEDCPSNATCIDVRELHEVHVVEAKGNYYTDSIKSVTFPLLPVTEIDTEKFSVKATGHVKNIARAVTSSILTSEDARDFIHLCAEMTRRNVGTVDGRKCPIHDVLPSMIINFCQKSRVHGGLRLCKRAARHCIYVDEPDILNAAFKMGRYGGKWFMELEKHVAASYHRKSNDKQHKTQTIFNETSLLCTKCSCTAGAKTSEPCSVAGPCTDLSQNSENDRHACVHTFVGMGCLCLEFHRGLAEQLLIEVKERIQFDSALETDQFKCDTSTLVSAAGYQTMAKGTIHEMLEEFGVGTSRVKRFPGFPKPQSIRPLRECRFMSPAKSIRTIVDNPEFAKVPENADDSENTSPNEDNVGIEKNDSKLIYDSNSAELVPDNSPGVTLDVDCIHSMLSVEAVKSVITRHYPTLKGNDVSIDRPIGFKLLEKRGNDALLKKISKEGDKFDKTVFQVNCEETLEKLFESLLTNVRVHPSASVGDNTICPQPKTPCEESANDCAPVKPAFNTARKKCMMHGCSSTGADCPLTTVPREPNFPNDKASEQVWFTYHKKCAVRREICDRLGLGRRCKIKDVRYCKSHNTEEKTIHFNSQGKRHKVTAMVPKPIGMKSFASPPQQLSKGVATDRGLARRVDTILKDDLALARQQSIEMNEIENGRSCLEDINEVVLEKVGLDVHKESSKKSHFSKPKRKVQNRNPKKAKKTRKQTTQSVHKLEDLQPAEVKRTTGFRNIVDLLSFALITCSGNTSKMGEKTSAMTWLEEWLFYFEFMYGRVHSRWIDYSKRWKCDVKVLRKIVRSKLTMALDIRNKWPRYASLEEDELFRKPHWNELLHGKNGIQEGQKIRMIMHDMTNVPLPKPSDPELMRALYNAYYAGECGKGGIFTQLCGWEGTMELFVGATGDSDYIKLSKVLELQELFAQNDKLPDGSILPFVNVFDKGYRVILDCYARGKQLCWQPAFARSDERYGSYATLHTGAVAFTRSGNERSVKQVKLSSLVKHGGSMMTAPDLERLADTWLVWGFQINFMHNSVH